MSTVLKLIGGVLARPRPAPPATPDRGSPQSSSPVALGGFLSAGILTGMRGKARVRGLLVGLALATLGTGCGLKGAQDVSRPPPDARRPVIKSEAELAAEREERIRAGQVVPTSAPVLLGAERVAAARRAIPPPIQPAPNAIEADILMVNKSVLTVAEVLFPLADEIEEIRQTQTPAGFRERVQRLIREETRRQIGTLLIHAEATANLSEDQRKSVEKAVQREIDNLAAQEFGGSLSAFKAHLSACGLTYEQYRAALERDLVTRQYLRERLTPQIQVRRDELLAYYRQNINRYCTPEMRELSLIEIPFARFLPPDQRWETADKTVRATARLAALRQVREVEEALASQPFDEVARQYSGESHAPQGGSWGVISRPLQPPYDEVSRRVFELEEGQWSEPVETPTGYCIVRCGRIQPAAERSFLEVQDELRRELTERKYTRAATEYILRLAENATVSAIEPFVAAAVKRVEQRPLPTGPAAGR